MKLTKTQKDKIINDLSIVYGSAKLRCDGFEISLQVERYKGFKYRVSTYVNGRFTTEWCEPKNNAPETKFLRKVVRQNVSPAKKLKLEKAIGKRRVAKDPFWSGSITYYLPDWSTGRAAMNHLCKVCESVELIESSSLFTDLKGLANLGSSVDSTDATVEGATA